MENKELLFKALDSIHKEPTRFYMGHYVTDSQSSLSPSELIVNPTCNTTLCLAGWVLHHHTQGDVKKIGDSAYCFEALKALKVKWGTEEWTHLREVMLLNKPTIPRSPMELVAQLENYDILAKGEYSYVE